MYQMEQAKDSDSSVMTFMKPRQTIDATNLARSMGDTEARALCLGDGGSHRLERLQGLISLIKTLPEKDFVACVEACEAIAENFSQSSSRREGRKKAIETVKKETVRFVG